MIAVTNEERALFEVLLGSRDRQALAGKRTVLRVAGGWVRDKLLKRESNDIDIALDNQSGVEFASSLNEFLKGEGYETHRLAVITANPDQSKHIETAVVRVLGFDIDFVNLRSETYSEESRIPSIQFGSPAEDAERRDFTVNALFYNLDTGLVEDFTKRGLSDLSACIIRTPLNPMVTFCDDPLRVLRAIRFSSRYAFSFDGQLINAARHQEIHQALIHKVSRERVYKELKPMICQEYNVSARPLLAMASLYYMGIFGIVFGIPGSPTLILEKVEGHGEREGHATDTDTGVFTTPGAGARTTQQEQEQDALKAAMEGWEARSFETCLWFGVLRSSYQRHVSEEGDEGMEMEVQVGEEAGGGGGESSPPPSVVPVGDLVGAGNDPSHSHSRILYLACATNGLRSVLTMEKKRSVRVPTVILRDGLKIDVDTIRAVQAVQDSIEPFQRLQRSINISERGGGGGDAAPVVSREEAGMLLRSVRELWIEALWCACADELSWASNLSLYKQWLAHIASQDDDGSAKTTKNGDSHDSYRENGCVHSWNNILFDVAIPVPAAAIIRKYSRLEAVLHGLELDGCWHLKPLLDGNRLMRELPGLKKGPLMGKVMDAQLRWQLRHGPDCSTEDCHAYLSTIVQENVSI